MIRVHFLEDEFRFSTTIVSESDHKCFYLVQMQGFMTIYIDILEQLSNVFQRIKIFFVSHRTDKLSIVDFPWSIKIYFLKDKMYLVFAYLWKKILKLLRTNEAIVICIYAVEYYSKSILQFLLYFCKG